MAEALFALLIGVAAIAWVVAVVSAVSMLRHRKRGFWWLVLHGWAWFNPDNFDPAAAAHRRRIGWSFAVFAGALAGGIVVVATMVA